MALEDDMGLVEPLIHEITKSLGLVSANIARIHPTS